jgi:hypothetical protein
MVEDLSREEYAGPPHDSWKVRCTMSLHRWILPVAILFSLSQASFAQTSDWAAITQLLSGQKVKVETADGKSHVGHVQSITDDEIRIGKNLLIQKQDIQQIRLWSSGHHARNSLIGLGIGAAAGVGVGAACGGKGSFVSKGDCMAVGAPLFGGLGAAIGALLPSHGAWHKVYRSK